MLVSKMNQLFVYFLAWLNIEKQVVDDVKYG